MMQKLKEEFLRIIFRLFFSQGFAACGLKTGLNKD
jgi:hypothetical protein